MFIFIQKIEHPISLHVTSRETRTLVTRARLKSFRPPSCNVRAHIACSTLRPVILSSFAVRACTRWLRILQQNLLHPALTKTFMGTSILFLNYRYLPIQNLLDTSTSPFKKTKKHASDLFHCRKKRWAETKGGSQTSYFPHKHQPTKKKIWRRCRIQDEQVLQNRTS